MIDRGKHLRELQLKQLPWPHLHMVYIETQTHTRMCLKYQVRCMTLRPQKGMAIKSIYNNYVHLAVAFVVIPFNVATSVITIFV